MHRKKGELNLPLIYLIIVGSCLSGVYMLYLVNKIPPFPCAFKTITGYPCPTCGATRALYCLFHFNLSSAFLANPLFFLGGIAFIAWIFYGFYMMFSGKKINILLTEKEKRLWRGGIVMLFFFNWLYLAAAGI